MTDVSPERPGYLTVYFGAMQNDTVSCHGHGQGTVSGALMGTVRSGSAAWRSGWRL